VIDHIRDLGRERPESCLRPVPACAQGNAHLTIAAAAELRQVGLADALSLLLLIREDKPVLYDKAAVRWFAK
jgi:hypothetical protein